MSYDIDNRKRDAIAVLRCGCSFADAMRISGLSLDEVQAAWAESERQKRPAQK